MSERGMGSAVGQVPEYAQMITAWVKEKARTPVLVKLTPNISDIRTVARAAKRGGADGLSAINTINSITGIDLDTFVPRPNVDGKSSHGGYCGPAVKPIALNMVQQIGRSLRRAAAFGHRRHRHVARCGGVYSAGLRDGAGVHGGDALRLSHCRGHGRGAGKLDARKGFKTIEDFRGSLLNRVTEWKHLNLNYKIVARIDEQKCIGCDLCHIACWDGAHQCIHLDRVTGPVDGHVELHPTPAAKEARAVRRLRRRR
jgi:dihydropyrimidine dehydrogenase (NAD+) subunit PreA